MLTGTAASVMYKERQGVLVLKAALGNGQVAVVKLPSVPSLFQKEVRWNLQDTLLCPSHKGGLRVLLYGSPELPITACTEPSSPRPVSCIALAGCTANAWQAECETTMDCSACTAARPLSAAGSGLWEW